MLVNTARALVLHGAHHLLLLQDLEDQEDQVDQVDQEDHHHHQEVDQVVLS